MSFVLKYIYKYGAFVAVCFLRIFNAGIFYIAPHFKEIPCFYINFVNKMPRTFKNAPCFFSFFLLDWWIFLKMLSTLSLR